METSYPLLRQIIRKKRRRLAKLDGDAKALRAELKVLRVRAIRVNVGGSKKAKSPGKKRIRSLSPRWKKVLIYMSKAGPQGISLQEIMNFCDLNALGITKEGFRSQMSLYSKKGFTIKLKQNIFTMTEEGMMLLPRSELLKNSSYYHPEDFARDHAA